MAEKIRVMRIITRMNVGGPAHHMMVLNGGLDPERFESLLVTGQTADNEGSVLDLARSQGLEVELIPEIGRKIHPWSDITGAWKLYRLIKRWQPHIVHTHTAKAGSLGRSISWLARVPIRLHTFHGHVFHGYFSPAKTRVFILIEKLMAMLSERIITISPRLKDELAAYGIAPKDKIKVIPLGLPLQKFADYGQNNGEFRKQLGVDRSTRLVGIVGRLVPIKNVSLFLEAAQRVHQLDPSVHFVVVGDGESKEALLQQTQNLGLNAVVYFTGWIHDLRPVYSDLDLTVVSSLNEGTPVSILEAMAAGCPVVATEVGGIPDIIGNNDYGDLVPLGNSSALSETISKVLNAPNNGPRTENAQQMVLNRYSTRSLVETMESFYESLIRSF